MAGGLKSLEMHKVLARYRTIEQAMFVQNARSNRSTNRLNELRAQRSALEAERRRGGVTLRRRLRIRNYIRTVKREVAICRNQIESAAEQLAVLTNDLEDAAVEIILAPDVLLLDLRDLRTLEEVIELDVFGGVIYTTSLRDCAPVEEILTQRGRPFERVN